MDDVPKEEQSNVLKLKDTYKITNTTHDIHAEFNEKLLDEAHKTGDYAKYHREKRGG